MTPRRRALIRRCAGVLAAGVLTTGATAKQRTLAGIVSTRGHFESGAFEDEVRLAPGITERGFETEGTIPGLDDPADDLLIFAHGLNTDDQAARDLFETATTALGTANADVPVVGYSYDSDVGGDSEQNGTIARRNGPKLGNVLRQVREQSPAIDLHLVGYSLGGLVAMSALECLEAADTGVTVDTVHMLGGAPDVDSVTTDGEYGPGVQAAAGEVYNFHRPNDLVLKFFNLFETPAVGRVGVDLDRAPPNVSNIDVTGDVDNHFTYPAEEGGCLDQVATRL